MPTHVQRLIYAVRTRHYDRLRQLLCLRGQVDARSAGGLTALHAAAEEGDVVAAGLLLDSGANIHARLPSGETPLHLAAGYGGGHHGWSDSDVGRRTPNDRRSFTTETASVLFDMIKAEHPNIAAELGVFDALSSVQNGEVISALSAVLSQPELIHREFAARGLYLERIDPELAEQLSGNPRYMRLVELLLDRGADLTAVADDWSAATVLAVAVQRGRPEMVKLLINRGADPLARTSPDERSCALIEMALEHSQTSTAEILWQHGARFDPAAEGLHAAAGNNRLDVVHWLLDHGADVNLRNRQGETPLLWAVGHHEVVAGLLARGADGHVRDNQGNTLLHKVSGWPKCLDLVLPLGLPVDERNAEGNTPLHLAAQSGGALSVKYLLRAGASVDVQNQLGNTPLHLIFFSDEFRPDVEFPVFHVLVASGADRTLRNHEGKTAFDLAIQWRYPEEFQRLLIPEPGGAVQAKSFIWLGEGGFQDLLPKALIGIQVEEETWPSCEHYFHALKSPDPLVRLKIRQAVTVQDAIGRLHGAKVDLPRSWPDRCDQIMRAALLLKFRQHPSLRELLLSTGDATLISDAHCDSYWLERRGVAFNLIGKMLMSIRAELQSEVHPS